VIRGWPAAANGRRPEARRPAAPRREVLVRARAPGRRGSRAPSPQRPLFSWPADGTETPCSKKNGAAKKGKNSEGKNRRPTSCVPPAQFHTDAVATTAAAAAAAATTAAASWRRRSSASRPLAPPLVANASKHSAPAWAP